jgi:hypothetical protein
MISNQCIAATEDMVPHILKYWKMRKNDKEILELLLANHIDTQVYGLGLVKIIYCLAEHN